jgi:hypothetical protein
MSESLDRFLNGPAAAAAVEQPVAEPAVEPGVVETPAPDAAPEPEPAAPVAAAVEDDDALPPSPNGTIPVSALQAEREKRNDWKSKAVRFETEKRLAEEQSKAAADQLKALQTQLEELRKAPPAAPVAPAALQQPAAVPGAGPEPAAPMPNPMEDPEGYARWQDQRQAMAAFNIRLETTEELLRDKEGDEAVDKAIAAFKAMVAAEEQTFGKNRSPLAQSLTVQRNPYKWMYSTVRKAEAEREIGGDLSAYRSKVEAEIRAKIEAEMAEKAAAGPVAPAIEIPVVQPRAAPNVVLPKSLATATSSAPRSAPAWTGPTPLGDIVQRR